MVLNRTNLAVVIHFKLPAMWPPRPRASTLHTDVTCSYVGIFLFGVLALRLWWLHTDDGQAQLKFCQAFDLGENLLVFELGVAKHEFLLQHGYVNQSAQLSLQMKHCQVRIDGDLRESLPPM